MLLKSSNLLLAIGIGWRSGSVARVIFRRPFARASVSDDCGASRDRSNSMAPALPPNEVRSSLSQVAALDRNRLEEALPPSLKEKARAMAARCRASNYKACG